MDSVLRKQEELYERITNAFKNYKKSPKERLVVSYIKSRLDGLEQFWSQFQSTHFQLVGDIQKEKRPQFEYFTIDAYSKCEDVYLEYKTKMMEDLRTNVTPSGESANSKNFTSEVRVPHVAEVKLPRIELPKFSGKYDEWQSFFDMFTSLIHYNDNLKSVQKLHYLKSCLSGEPELLLRNLPITEANYHEAWNQLSERYTNKRYNCNEVMKRLFSQKAIVSESASATKQLLDNTSACLKSLQNLGIDIESWDAIIIYLILSKLDTESRKLWESHVNQIVNLNELPTWKQLTKFLETRFRTLEMLDGGKSVPKAANSNTNFKQIKQKSFHSTVDSEKREKKSYNACTMCSGPHPLYQCKQFENQTPEKRTEYVQSNRLCFNCLSSSHSVRGCHQSSSCRRCGRRHHTMLHYEREQHQISAAPVASLETTKTENQQTRVQSQQPSKESELRVVAHFAKNNPQGNQSRVLLATALVKIVSSNGYSLLARALIDQGSEASLITEATAQSLSLKRASINGFVSGVGEGQTRTKGMVSFKIESLHNTEFSVLVNAFVLKKITSFLPSKQTLIQDWPDIESLALADPNYGSPEIVDILLGVDVYGEIIKEGILKHPSLTGPVAQNTQLGWIVSGRVGQSFMSNRPLISLHIQKKEDELLKIFWEIEREPDSIEKIMTEEEKRCEKIYNETYKRDNEGRFIVRLPFKGPNPECVNGSSKEVAHKRFNSLERKLLKNPKLREEYSHAIADYLEQQHMCQIFDEDQIADPNVVYLPHHAVVREDKETTKVRVVFDASCKGLNNISLNDELLVGPKIQQDLRHILMRWRMHPICIVADLKQMYRQIRLNDQDTDFQRILWRSDPKEPMQHYRMQRLTFGTACAPYLAVKSLQTLAREESLRYPVASKITLEDYYMDDLLSGCETQDEAIDIYTQMTYLMKAGGFKLQKWCSNSNELLEHIDKANLRREGSVVFKSNDMIKVLGISWNKSTDKFEYTLQLPMIGGTVTKRSVLSDIARLYDPMGWIAPVIITGKVFIQKLWKSGLDWDEALTTELLREWCIFRDDLANIPKINISRWLQTKRDYFIELHVFADASQAGYAAAVYLKSRDEDGEPSINLITSKTKVAPVQKEISIPRLELCAALLAAKLIHEVAHILKIPKDKLYAWSDSTVALAWIAGEPHRWTTFVSNRVSEILNLLERDRWGHVGTNHNPADCASRGMTCSALVEHELWWHGPRWLQSAEYSIKKCQQFETSEEEKPAKSLAAVIQPKEEFIWMRFSRLPNMLRVLAYCKRFLNMRLPINQRINLPKHLSAAEIDGILLTCIKETQCLYFKDEIKQLKSDKCVPKGSRLHTLCPILDENCVVRVGGRTNEAQVEYDKRHPIIIPSESHVAKLIVSDAHIKTLHGGPQFMLNFLRSKYWIIQGRNLVKKIYRTCVKCARYSRQSNNQLMGQLPKDRLKPTRAFKISGVDFTGHINIRCSPGRGSKSYKGYICVFVCMISKAIHLEAVTDLTSQGFIAAFRRFVSRRGHCQTLYSDNGTNFVGADKELRQMFNSSVSQLPEEISQLLTNDGTTWTFIPPHAPNFGGLWEAGVRSTKMHLKRVVGDSTLTYEELSTVLTQIEACLNSRPLSYLSDNPDDPLPLTPGHFLVGEPLIVIPDEYCKNVALTGLKRWKFTQRMVNEFWKKWSDEYLVTLNQRYKWTTKGSEPEINDIVIIKDHNLPPAKWLLGRITDKHTGKDNITRVVTVKTKHGFCKRPCNKLCILPKPEDIDN